MDLLLYFALAAIATIVIFSGLAELTRPVRKVDKLETTQQEPQRIYYLKNPSVGELSFTAPLSDKDAKTLQGWLDAEDFTIRILGTAHESVASDSDDTPDSFSHDELWEAAAKMHRETPDEKATIDRWERDAIENAGKE